MNRSKASFANARAERYLAQLCKHFAHKVPATYNEAGGRVDFPWGVCFLEVAENRLDLVCEATDAEGLERVQAVVTDHLERFAWRDEPQLDWQTA